MNASGGPGSAPGGALAHEIVTERKPLPHSDVTRVSDDEISKQANKNGASGGTS